MNAMNRQHGIALVFTLLILLILTLVGISSIQQNKVQFLMAGNYRSQTMAFSEADNKLALAEEYIRSQREPLANTTNDGTCNTNAGQFTPVATGTIPLGITNATASVESCYCLATASACTNTIAACLSEIYSIRLQFSGVNSSFRTVESNYAVRCEIGA